MNKLRHKLSLCSTEVQSTWQKMESGFEQYFQRINELFKDYTLHDRSHLEALETILDWLVPDSAWNILNEYEVFCLLCALWGHDIGMGASDTEIEKYCLSKNVTKPSSKDLVSFLRQHHANLSRNIVSELLTKAEIPTLSGLASLCGDLAHSHHESTLDYFPSEQPVGLKGERIRIPYLALLVRLADILHCTADRAPYLLMRTRAIYDSTSILHWKRHQCTVGVGLNQTNSSIEVSLATDDIQIFEWGHDYFKAIEDELELAAVTFAHRNLRGYGLDLTSFQARIVANTPFISEIIRFHVDAPAAIKTLIGRHLYDDESVVVRELLQNAIDACQIRAARDHGFRPLISLSYDSSKRTLIIEDNGIGMSLDDITQNLLTSCSLGFRSGKSNPDLISKFGIGFLTVFLVSKSVRIFTRALSAAATDGFRVEISNTENPAAVFKIQKDDAGTRIELQLQDEVELLPEALSKWYPVGAQSSWVTMKHNGNDLVAPIYRTGQANDGFTFETETFVKEESEFKFVLRAITLSKDGRANTPCGLSFQNVENHEAVILDVPDVKARIYNRSIPIVNVGGEAPKQVLKGSYQPLIFRQFFPFELHILKPGAVDLNLARNAFIPSKSNDEFFKKVDNAASDLIAMYFQWMVKQGADPAAVSTYLIEEYWLAHALRASTVLTSQEQVADDTHIQRYLDIWRAAHWWYVLGDGTAKAFPLSRSIDSDVPTLFIRKEVLEALAAMGLFKSLMEDARKCFGDFHLVIGPKYHHRSGIEPAAHLKAMSSAVVFYDLMHLGTKLPPLVAYYFGKVSTLNQSSHSSAALYGSRKPICGFTRAFKAIGLTGSNGHQIFINTLADANAVSELAPIIAAQPLNKLHYSPSSRISLEKHLETLGIPAKYLKSEFIENSLRIDLQRGELKLPT